MNPKIRILIDIDNVLVPFGLVLKKELDLFSKKSVPFHLWKWEVWTQYDISKSAFYKIVDRIHRDIHQFTPFPNSVSVINQLANNYFIMIASDRKKYFYNITKKWLDDNNISYHRLYLGVKEMWSDYFDIAFDDSPSMQQSFLDKNKKVFSFRYSWCLQDSRIIFIDDWQEIINYLDLS